MAYRHCCQGPCPLAGAEGGTVAHGGQARGEPASGSRAPGPGPRGPLIGPRRATSTVGPGLCGLTGRHWQLLALTERAAY